LLTLKHTHSTDRGRHAAETHTHTHTDGRRDASTVKLIHLKSLTVTSQKKPVFSEVC